MKKITQRLLSLAISIALVFGLVFVPEPNIIILQFDDSSVITNIDNEENDTCNETNSDPTDFGAPEGEILE